MMNTAKEEIANEEVAKQNGYEQQHRNNFFFEIRAVV
jgi:hypothetical protein